MVLLHGHSQETTHQTVGVSWDRRTKDVAIEPWGPAALQKDGLEIDLLCSSSGWLRFRLQMQWQKSNHFGVQAIACPHLESVIYYKHVVRLPPLRGGFSLYFMQHLQCGAPTHSEAFDHTNGDP